MTLDNIARYIIDYAVVNNVRYLRDKGYVMLYPGESKLVYFPGTKAFFIFIGDVMEKIQNPNLNKIQEVLDFAR